MKITYFLSSRDFSGTKLRRHKKKVSAARETLSNEVGEQRCR